MTPRARHITMGATARRGTPRRSSAGAQRAPNPAAAVLRRTRVLPAQPARAARGMSLLEVVFAVVLLALVASAVTGAISFVGGSEVRAQKRLGAYELANRLILQHLDDPNQLPDRTRPIEYDRFRYRWELDISQVRMRTPSLATQREVNAQANDRFEQVTVAVFAVQEGVLFEPPAEQLAVLTRVYDPFAPRNPDAVERMDADALIEKIQGLFGGDLPAGGRNRSGGGSGNGGGSQ